MENVEEVSPTQSVRPTSRQKSPLRKSAAETLDEVTKQIHEIRNQRRQTMIGQSKGRVFGPKTDYSSRPIRRLHHPKLEYIYGEIVFSPYLAKISKPYSKEVYNMSAKLKDLKREGFDFDKASPDQLPFNVKKIKNEFIREVVNFEPNFGASHARSKLDAYLSSVGEEASQVSASFQSSTAFSSSAGSREYKSLNLVCAGARGGPVKFIKSLRQLKSAKTSPSNVSMDSQGNIRDDVLRQPQSAEQTYSSNSSFAEYDTSEFEEQAPTNDDNNPISAATIGTVLSDTENLSSSEVDEQSKHVVDETNDHKSTETDSYYLTAVRSDNHIDAHESTQEDSGVAVIVTPLEASSVKSRIETESVLKNEENIEHNIEQTAIIIQIEDIPDCCSFSVLSAARLDNNDYVPNYEQITSTIGDNNSSNENAAISSVLQKEPSDNSLSSSVDCSAGVTTAPGASKPPKSVLRKSWNRDNNTSSDKGSEDAYDVSDGSAAAAAAHNVRFHEEVEYFRYPPRVSSAIINIGGGDLAAPVNEEQNPVKEEQTPVNEEQTPVNVEQNLVNEEQNPVNEEQNPVSEEQTPVNEEQTPVNEKQNPVNEEQNPGKEEQNPVNEEQNPLVQQSSLDTVTSLGASDSVGLMAQGDGGSSSSSDLVLSPAAAIETTVSDRHTAADKNDAIATTQTARDTETVETSAAEQEEGNRKYEENLRSDEIMNDDREKVPVPSYAAESAAAAANTDEDNNRDSVNTLSAGAPRIPRSSVMMVASDAYPVDGYETGTAAASSETAISATAMESIVEETASMMSTNTSNVLTTSSTIDETTTTSSSLEEVAAVPAGNNNIDNTAAIHGEPSTCIKEKVEDNVNAADAPNEKTETDSYLGSEIVAGRDKTEISSQEMLVLPEQQLDISAQERLKFAQMNLAESQQRFIETNVGNHVSETDDIETLS